MPLVSTSIHIAQIPPKGYHIFVEGKIQRKSVRFLIDTGASKSVIDAAYANIHFPNAFRILTDHQTTGLGAQIPNAGFVRLRNIRIGKHHLKPISFALLDLSVVNQAYAEARLDPVIAILGGDVLRKYGMIINYQDATLSFQL